MGGGGGANPSLGGVIPGASQNDWGHSMQGPRSPHEGTFCRADHRGKSRWDPTGPRQLQQVTMGDSAVPMTLERAQPGWRARLPTTRAASLAPLQHFACPRLSFQLAVSQTSAVTIPVLLEATEERRGGLWGPNLHTPGIDFPAHALRMRCPRVQPRFLRHVARIHARTSSKAQVMHCETERGQEWAGGGPEIGRQRDQRIGRQRDPTTQCCAKLDAGMGEGSYRQR